MMFKNCIIYLIGLPGVGKRTIGEEICRQLNFCLIDNHRINNVVFPFVRVDGQTKMPPEIWEACDAIREIALNILVKVGDRNFNYVFTNMLLNNFHDANIYRHLERTAGAIGACFLPVSLVCDIEENKRRIVSSDRDLYYKLTDPQKLDQFVTDGALEIEHPNAMTLDVTHLKPDQSAQVILDHLNNLV